MPQSVHISDKKTRAALAQKLGELKSAHLKGDAKQKATQLGVDFVDVSRLNIPPTVLEIIPLKRARALQVIPYAKSHDHLKLAALNPKATNIKTLVDELKKRYTVPITVNLTDEKNLKKALQGYNFVIKQKRTSSLTLDEKTIESLESEITDHREIADKVNSVPLSEFLNLILAAALKVNASDIHFQPEENRVMVRFRIDGIVHSIFELDPKKFNEIKKRIKLIAKLKINIEDRSQDGSFSMSLHDKHIDMRVATLPTNFGENITIRILDPHRVALNFSALGLSEHDRTQLEKEMKKPNGMIISTGPTGSGKTTTLYTILKALNTGEGHIVTLEDPVEYQLEGIAQTQVTEKIGFAEGLKAVLRQDPDIVMIGEIRDLETGSTAVNAALTGHLVLSTVHTNDAIGVIPRLAALGIKPFLLAPALNIIIAQRLVRRLCQECKVVFAVNEKLRTRALQELKKIPKEKRGDIDISAPSFFAGHSCKSCSGLGFKGRVGIFELLRIDEQLIATIQGEDFSEDTIRKHAATQGMISMVQDGLLKALQGLTTVEEVFRVAD